MEETLKLMGTNYYTKDNVHIGKHSFTLPQQFTWHLYPDIHDEIYKTALEHGSIVIDEYGVQMSTESFLKYIQHTEYKYLARDFS